MSSPDDTSANGDREILNCGAGGPVRFAFECPRRWSALTATDDPRRRHCTGCQRDVFWCHNLHEASLRAEQDECIAVPRWLAEGVRDDTRAITIGQVAPLTERMTAAVTRRVEGDD